MAEHVTTEKTMDSTPTWATIKHSFPVERCRRKGAEF